MSKGKATKHLILQRAYEAATKVGLEGLTIGELAEDLKLSKSGLHGHFGKNMDAFKTRRRSPEVASVRRTRPRRSLLSQGQRFFDDKAE